jgi:6-pyruvoyltetrahydropterin/6-carboxytetrahydropterin synthase
MFRIRKLFRLEAAHQLATAFSKDCSDTIHGHSYVVEVFLVAGHLENGMVLDFGVLKENIEATKEAWDHALFLPASLANREEYQKVLPTQRKVIILEENPTAENMAYHLFQSFKEAVRRATTNVRVAVEKVRVHETSTGWAEYEE